MHIILPKANNIPYLQIVTVFQIYESLTMYMITSQKGAYIKPFIQFEPKLFQ